MRMLILTFALLLSGVSNTNASEKHKHVHDLIHHGHNKKPIKNFRQFGMASWYGYESGNVTKSGEKFRPLGLTAAHNTLPMHTMVRVTNLENKRSVIVRINDTGGFKKYHRIIDLSLGAARKLKITGVEKVKLEVI